MEEAVGSIRMDPRVAKWLWKKAYDDVKRDRDLRYVTHKQFQEWLETFHGCYFTGWLCLGKSFKSFRTLEGSMDHFASAESGFVSEFCRLRDQASGSDIMSNMEWASSAGDGGDHYTPWKKIFRYMTAEFRMTPAEVGRLTWWQLQIYLRDPEKLEASKRIFGDEAKAAGQPLHGKRPGRGPRKLSDAEMAEINAALAAAETAARNRGG